VERIRLAQAGDVCALEALVGRAYARYIPRIGRPPAPMGADYGALVRRGLVSVLEDEGGLVGLIVLLPRGDHLLVENVAVSPGRQGRGLGRRLMSYAEERARALALPELRLYTNERMTENIGFYRALGYEETGRGLEDGFARVYFRKTLA
jgi:ribosomal protein S18 acetylase RimI-like enzyme